MSSLVDTEKEGAVAEAATEAGNANEEDVAMADIDGAVAASDTATTSAIAALKSVGKQAKKSSSGKTSPTTNNSAVLAEPSSSSAATTSASQAIAASNLAAAVQMAASLQLNGLLSLLTQSSTPGSASAADPTVLQGGAFATAALVQTGTTSDNEAAAAAAAAHHSSLLSNAATWQVPTPEQVQQAALKAVQDAPPFVHLSKIDSAPQLKIVDAERLTLKGGMRGYRMSRATHGVSSSTTEVLQQQQQSNNSNTNRFYYYYEILVLDPPPISEIVSALPPNARLGPSLQKQIQQALEYDKQHPNYERQQQQDETVDAAVGEDDSGSNSNKLGRKRKAETDAAEDSTSKAQLAPPPPQVGGHLRIGWSMRTGDLQAPVGYDKWSYGFRSLNGSKSHQSRREDGWGGEAWGPGDVVGCAIYMDGGSNTGTTLDPGASTDAVNSNNNNNKNEIRFFKNGINMGHFVISKGKREGGEAFVDIQPGTYYPAISSYLGGAVQVNFGPHFIHPPRPNKLPHGMNSANNKTIFQPMSSLQPPPLSEEEILSRLKRKTIFAKVHAKESKDTPDMKMAAFKEAVLTESRILQDAYRAHKKKHLQFILEARKARKLNTADIEEELNELLEGEAAATTTIANNAEVAMEEDDAGSGAAEEDA